MECAAHVGKSFVTYPCSLEKGHEGPCMALENTPSVRQRRAWEEEHHPAGGVEVIEAPPEVIQEPEDVAVATVTARTPQGSPLVEAHEWLLAAAQGVERLLAQRADIDTHFEAIESALSGDGDATEARASLSILRAMLRS